MNEWNTNSPETHPPCQVPCIIRTRDGRELEAQLVHLNGEYHSRITKAKLYKWRLGKHNFIEDNEVKEWRGTGRATMREVWHEGERVDNESEPSRWGQGKYERSRNNVERIL